METQFKRVDPLQYAHAWENIPYADKDPLQIVHIYTPGDAGDYLNNCALRSHLYCQREPLCLSPNIVY